MVEIVGDRIDRSVELGSYRLNPSTGVQATSRLGYRRRFDRPVDKDRLDPYMDFESMMLHR
jgi:hypothetical protein